MPSGATDTQLASFLASHHAPCPACLYDLKGVTTDTCPECGHRITLGVTTPPSQRAIKLLCLALALSGLLLNTADTLRQGYYALRGAAWFGPIDWTLLYGCAGLALLGFITALVICISIRRMWSPGRVRTIGILAAIPVSCQAVGYLIIVLNEIL